MRQGVASFSKPLVAALIAAAIAVTACGGGGGSPGVPIIPIASTATGTTPTTPTTPTAPTTPVAADLIVSLDKVALKNSGTDEATLTATAVDASRNVVASAPVQVVVDNNAVFTPSTGTATGTDGKFAGKIGIGGDKSNRQLRYTVTSGTVVKTGSIRVAGITVTAAASPSTPTPGQAVSLTVRVRDSVNAAVVGAAVTASGIAGFTFPAAVTNDNGDAVFSFSAPGTDGTYPISLQSAGVTSSFDLPVLTAGNTSIPPAVGTIVGASATATPIVVATNSAGSNGSQSEVRALFLTNGNNPLKNVRVRFKVISSALPNESLSSGSGLVYSDTSGNAKTSYIAATTPSPNNGVIVRACYDLNDFADTLCPNFVDTSLTVASTPVSLSIGSDNVIEKSASGITYIKKFEIQAVNAAGNPASDVPLSAVVDIQGYWKGPTIGVPPTLQSNDYSNTTGGVATNFKWCPNEDLNRNGVLEVNGGVSEDTNGDGQLTPRQASVAIAFPSSNKTDATGLATLQLQYPQNLATWLRVKITVTAGVTGSEGSATYYYILKFAQEDAANGSFLTPPYGSAQSCSTPN